jgi:hypothetical protein
MQHITVKVLYHVLAIEVKEYFNLNIKRNVMSKDKEFFFLKPHATWQQLADVFNSSTKQ